MNENFSASFSKIMSLEITLEEAHAEDAKLPILYYENLFKLTEFLKVKDPEKRLFKGVSSEEFRNQLRELVGLVHSREIGCEEVDFFRRVIAAEKSFPRTLLWHKILEEIIIRSQNEEAWRDAMDILAVPLYNGVHRQIAGTSREELCIGCLKRIYDAGEGQKRNLASQILGGVQKVTLVSDVLAGALFTDDAKVAHEISAAICGVDDEISLAAMVVFSNFTGGRSVRIMDRLLQYGEGMDQEEGRKQMMQIVVSGDGNGYRTGVYLEVIKGIRKILDVRRITLPHPWYGEQLSNEGIPVPTFARDGIQLAAFDTLAKMGNGEALVAMVDGIGHLIAPHIQGIEENRIKGAPQVGRAVRPVARSFVSLLQNNGVFSSQAKDISGVLFGYPTVKTLHEVETGTLLGLSPVLGRLVNAAAQVGAAEELIPVIAGEGFVRAMLMETSGKSREEKAQLIARNMGSSLQSQKQIFGAASGLPNMEATKEFLRSLARNQAIAARMRAAKTPKRLR